MIEIIPLASGHGEIVSAIHELAFEEKWLPEDFENLMLAQSRFGFLALHKEIPFGFILCQGDAIECDIISIATDPNKRRKGVASKLLEKICEISQRVLLEVATDNESAFKFYKAYGFEEISRRKNYYKRHNFDYVDAIIMEFKPS